jgi:uncharacterized protein YndB with AHSA1/START domain
MPSATNSVTIARPPDVVFAFVSDGLNAPKWRSGVLDIALVSGSGVGAEWKQGVKGPGGRRIDADYVVTAYEPGRRLAFRATAGPVRPTGDFTLEAVPEGTKLTFSLNVELAGIKKLLMGGQVQKTMDAEVAALARLKEVVEQSG